VKFDDPLPVDLNYDTQVIEGGVLRLYPDVYRRGTNTVEKLRDELQRSGLLIPPPDDQTLRQMLKRVNQREAFVVKISDLAAGRALLRRTQ
jgi:hypothetical protein